MFWFKLGKNWYIDLSQIREFGRPGDRPNAIAVTFNDGHEEYYRCDDRDKIFKDFEEAIKYLQPFQSIDIEIPKKEILESQDYIPNNNEEIFPKGGAIISGEMV